ncbi:putative membrane protein [Rhizobium mesoamericanum]|uniref:PACE efflux transporter n=1 Tax=Rhizobium mesoamericanum TaxID=1079800 RepID=UPI00278042D1|nr:PACE efflux transporter [Rhizobium mesoamericanum]MDQ0562877.1 putative membrane protein [Rhizobium mesoamericanum]
MRKAADRIRHAISFELIGLALVTPLGAVGFGMPVADIGVIGVVGATVATVWNYIYNLGFDHPIQRLTGGTQKSVAMRVLHAVMFEIGLLLALLPMIAWYLGIGILQALMMDVSFALFYMVYAFVFNWAYDQIFPLPDWQPAA